MIINLQIYVNFVVFQQKTTTKTTKNMSNLPALAEQNNKEEIVLRLQNGADINEQNQYGYTALYRACQNNNTEIVQILLRHDDINVNLQSFYGVSPLYAACWSIGYECALLMLQDPRVDINMADNDDGISPFMSACYNGNSQTVQLLLSFGRNINIYKKSTKDCEDIKSGSTAIDVAKQKNKTDVVQFLEQYQNNPKETQKLWRNQLNLKGKK